MASIAQTNAFGIVTVMDVKVYGLDKQITVGSDQMTIEQAYADHVDRDALNAALKVLPAGAELCKIDHMQVATLSTDGPNITIQGGKFNNNLIKYGKTARCEMTDALGQMDALVNLGGAEYLDPGHPENGIAVTDKFGAPVCIVGDSFVVDQKTGKHVPVTVILYQFLPDSTPSFAFDSGNAATFDLNGDLLAVEFASTAIGNECEGSNGTFFSLVFDDCSLTPTETKTVPVEHGTNFLVVPESVTRDFSLSVQPNYAAVAVSDGFHLTIGYTKTDGTSVADGSRLASWSDNLLSLSGTPEDWKDVARLDLGAIKD